MFSAKEDIDSVSQAFELATLRALKGYEPEGRTSFPFSAKSLYHVIIFSQTPFLMQSDYLYLVWINQIVHHLHMQVKSASTGWSRCAPWPRHSPTCRLLHLLTQFKGTWHHPTFQMDPAPKPQPTVYHIYVFDCQKESELCYLFQCCLKQKHRITCWYM